MAYSALIDNQFKDIINNNQIQTLQDDIDLLTYIQPASLDIPVSNKAYLVNYKFLPFNKKIREVIKDIKLEELNLDENPILFKNQTYLIPCLKLNNIDEDLVLKASPKSSIGRIDMMVRAINDNSAYYDYIEKSDGILWLEVTPQSFNVRLKTGIAISQLMLLKRTADNVNLKDEDLIYNRDGHKLKNNMYKNDEIILEIEIPKHRVIGYVARKTNNIIDLSKKDHCKLDYFKEIKFIEKDNRIILEKDKFYILRTKNFIQIPPKYSAEMLPLNNIFGEFRVHYAGFFDPGFGYLNKGNQGVLEVRPHEDLMICDGQPICSMKFYNNKEIPNKIYGQAKNNYSSQRDIKLSKYFK